MKYRDNLSEHYSSVLEGSYDCIDRLVLNAYCTNLHIAGGLRLWFRALKGADKDLDNNQLMLFQEDSAGESKLLQIVRIFL
ncbi:MAG: hypothetical protein MRK02_17500 [Candidatus Scalindua sp.]|nr:hypothetical protein [Candidatus Scalindua sp.]